MDHKKDQEFEQTLAESELLLRGAARSASDDADLTLESILAEFGSREDGTEAAAEPEDVGAPEPRPAVRIGKTAAPAAELPEPQPSAPPEEPSAAEPAQDTVSLQEVLESTVQSVLDEEAEEPIELLPPKRRGLFSRRRLRDTERLYSDESGEEPPQEEPDEPEDFFTEDFGERDDTPEPDAGELAADYRDDARMGLRSAQAALLVTALSWLALLLDHFGVMPALFAEERLLSCLPFFVAELLVCVLGRDVFVYAFEQLRARTVTYELLSSLACAVTLADTALDFFLPARAALAVPFHAVAMLGMSCACLGAHCSSARCTIPSALPRSASRTISSPSPRAEPPSAAAARRAFRAARSGRTPPRTGRACCCPYCLPPRSYLPCSPRFGAGSGCCSSGTGACCSRRSICLPFRCAILCHCAG